MPDASMRLRCACGWETMGTERDVVAAATEHGEPVHKMRPTRDEVLAMVVPDTIRFRASIRHWNPEKKTGLAVADIPAEHVPAIGGLKQQRVHGRIGGAEFTSNVMPAGGGRLALSISKAIMTSAGAGIGADCDVEITRVGGDAATVG